MRDLKPSLTGRLAMVSAFTGAALLASAVLWSFRMSGEGAGAVGTLGFLALIFAAGALVMGVLSRQEANIRPLPSDIGIRLGAVLCAALLIMYIRGVF